MCLPQLTSIFPTVPPISAVLPHQIKTPSPPMGSPLKRSKFLLPKSVKKSTNPMDEASGRDPDNKTRAKIAASNKDSKDTKKRHQRPNEG